MKVLSEVITRIEYFRKSEKWEDCRVLLDVLSPWVNFVQLEGSFALDVKDLVVTDKEKQEYTFTLVSNLFFLTVVFGNRFLAEIEPIWKSLIISSQNYNPLSAAAIIVDIILMQVLCFQNQTTINAAKTVAVAIGQTQYGDMFFDAALERLCPHSLGINSFTSLEDLRALKCIPSSKLYYADLQGIGMATPLKSRVSPGFLLAAFVVDMLIAVDRGVILRHLPMLLPVIFIHLDASVNKTEEMRLLLVNVIQAILLDDTSKKDRMDATITALNMKEGKRLWKYEDNIVGKSGMESEEQIGALALTLIELFDEIYPNLREDWSYFSLKIGTICRDYHLASRSLQIFRKICSDSNPGHLGLILRGLGHCICDSDEKMQKLSNELIICLKKYVEFIPISEIPLKHPQIFWTAVTLLSSGLEWEYHAGLKMTKFILKSLDLTNRNLIQHILDSLPPKWPGSFEGLLRLLLKGFSCSETESNCLELINSLLFVSLPIFLDSSPSKFLFVSLANTPRLLQLYTPNCSHKLAEQIFKTADLLALAGSSFNCDSLARLFTAFANQRVSKPEDFLKQLVLIIRDEFSSSEWDVIRFCLGILRNPQSLYPECGLQLLEYLLNGLISWDESSNQDTEFREAWLMPLIALLDTPHYLKAAYVLNSMLSRQKITTEAEMTTIVGGSHNLYNYVKRARKLRIPVYSESGWLLDQEGGEVENTRRKLVAVTKLCENLEHPPKKRGRMPMTKKVTEHNRENLLLQFKELEDFFRASIGQ
jgi:hypothetical protein